MLKVRPIISVECREQCDYCGKGEMIATTREKGLTIYPHSCNVCSEQGLFKKPHPYQCTVGLLDFLSDSQDVINKLKAERDEAEQ